MVNKLVKLTDKVLEVMKNKWKTNLASFKPAFTNTYKVVMTKRHPTPQPRYLVAKGA